MEERIQAEEPGANGDDAPVYRSFAAKLDAMSERGKGIGRQSRIISEVLAERRRQDEKWGEQNHDDAVWALIFGEEFGEVQKEIYERHMMDLAVGPGRETDEIEERLQREIVQMVAVGFNWLECRARRA